VPEWGATPKARERGQAWPPPACQPLVWRPRRWRSAGGMARSGCSRWIETVARVGGGTGVRALTLRSCSACLYSTSRPPCTCLDSNRCPFGTPFPKDRSKSSSDRTCCCSTGSARCSSCRAPGRSHHRRRHSDPPRRHRCRPSSSLRFRPLRWHHRPRLHPTPHRSFRRCRQRHPWRLPRFRRCPPRQRRHPRRSSHSNRRSRTA